MFKIIFFRFCLVTFVCNIFFIKKLQSTRQSTTKKCKVENIEFPYIDKVDKKELEEYYYT